MPVLNLQSCSARHKLLEAVAPDVAPCPTCRTLTERREVRSRLYWVPDLAEPTVTEVRAGCYICPECPPGKRWFMLLPEDFRTSRQYSLMGYRAVVDLVRQHRMSVEEAAAVGRKLLHLEKLDAATVLEWLRHEGEAINPKARLQELAATFSGELALDEVYDGEWYQLKATDPINGVELAWKLERGTPKEEDVERFLRELKDAGIEPKLIATDGSSLYPAVLARVWPEAKHQRCIFHFIKQVNEDLGKAFWAIYDAMPKPPERKAGRPKKRGRPREDKRKRNNRLQVRLARFIVLKREDRLCDQEREVLERATGLCPELSVLRRFINCLHELVGPTTQSQAQALERRQAILNDAEFKQTPALAKALSRLGDDDLFTRLTRYLDFENADRTSNHVERENREFRNRQHTHYRMRSQRSLRALLCLLLVRRPVPSTPQRLQPKPVPSKQESHAA